MSKFTKKLLNIILKPARMCVKGGFCAAKAIKNFSLKGLLYGISRLGEKIVKLIYSVGLAVENCVICIAKAVYFRILVRSVKFIYACGEFVIKWTRLAALGSVKIIMAIPKSFVRNFSYWAPALSAVGVVAVIFSANFYALALKVTVNGETVGYVANETEFSNVVSEVENSLGESIGENYVMTSNPEYSFTIVNKEKLKTQESKSEIHDSVYSIVCEEIGEHYGLYIDGELVAASENEDTLNTVLNELKAPYVTGAENETVEFVANVEIKKGIYAPSYFYTEDEIRAKFSASTNPMYYTIQEDDYLSDISKATGLTRAQLYALNPGLDDRRLVPGKKLNISQPEIYLGIKIVKTINYTEEIGFDTVKIEDNSLYKTQTKIKTSGRTGEKDIVAEVTYIDGAQVSKKIISETVTREPITKEIYVGTKSLPTSTSPLAGTGTFIRPINGGYVSCAFGGYRGHTGTDLTMSGAYGKPAYASASGTVIYAGWSGGYGKVVKIRHSNGYETWYAHLSAINVSVGDNVYQGQQIGRIGSTGNSSGPHLHFEMRINGRAVNAMKYIG